MPLALKPYPRLPGAAVAIIDEAHVVGEDAANMVWLDEVPDSTASVGILGFTEVTGTPAAGEFRVFYTGILASAIEFNAADDSASVSVSYTGLGGIVTARDYNRVVTVVNTLEAAQADLTALEEAVEALQTDVSALQNEVSAATANISQLEGSIETMQGDVQSVYDAQQTQGTAITALQGGLSAAQGNITALQSSVSVVEGTVASIPDYYVGKNQIIDFDREGALIRAETDEENGGPFQSTLHRFTNDVGDRKNNVSRWGYNIAEGGGPEDPTKHSLAIEMESYYRPLEEKIWTEAHLAFTTIGGLLWRPWTMEADINAGDPGAPTTRKVRLRFETDEVNFSGRLATPNRVTISDAGILVRQAFPVRHLLNNQNFLEQINAAGDHFIPVIRLNTSDRVVVGNAATATEIPGGIVLTAPNNTRYVIGVDNAGLISITPL